MKKSKLLVFILLFSFVINILPKQLLADEGNLSKNKVVEEKKELVVKKEGTDKEISDKGKNVKRRDVEETKLFDIEKSAVVEDTKPEDNNKPDDKENNKPDNNKPDDKENNKPENNKPDNKEDNKENNKQNNKEDDKQKPENADKNKKPEINKEKGTKIPKTAIAGSSTLLLAFGLLGMYISKRKNGR